METEEPRLGRNRMQRPHMAGGWRPGPYRDLIANHSGDNYELRETGMIRATAFFFICLSLGSAHHWRMDPFVRYQPEDWASRHSRTNARYNPDP
ncbi:hypothetical protein BDV32DRAFT_118413 [Aspergillus pseudonomiae]|uniref:Uncharacterized protein n=1 Tax=Aspergillus pseudonomiae TaxID=1506151 RepID=A0A5N7D1V8_9EURO|nr:uncharacterized protein BDV37DRAFT_257767 [Aspergillus pseudonomiae]KAB8263768.1 hypothetical protein BDV32DRAFT_118413 [Aspergillus pseudonomiae]KAE8400395.1 hypothetical protein BDV37DRAFT_257767 [Aspergillus pseudonomiae]